MKSAPPGETPQEKVRRLRAAADAAKLGQISTFDKIVIRGRVWADRAHRFTTLTLISATCMAAPLHLN
jgi:Cytochrome oxidase c assembly